MVEEAGVDDSRRPLFWAACAGMFVFGITLAILGALFGLPQMRERIHADLAQQGDIFLMLYFGIFVSTLIVGPIIDSFGNKIVLTLSAALVVAGLLGFSVASSFGIAMACAFLLGFGGGGLNTASNALVADLYTDNRGAMLNLLGVFFGFGALFIPLLAAAITGRLTIPQLLLIAALLAGICTVAYVILPFPPPGEAAGFSIFASIRAAKYPSVMLFAMLLFFESGNESAIGGWTSTYVGSVGGPPRAATWILSAYWAGLMIGRIAGARILAIMRKERLVFISGIGSAIGTAVLVASPSLITMAAGAVIVGLSFAAIYPTTLAIAADRYQRLAGTIFGLLFAVGLVGGMIFPWTIGHISEHYGLRAAMLLPLVGAVMIIILVSAIKKEN
jgi:FHS family glucose/mannose:H+ symporter-like MFS transporter